MKHYYDLRTDILPQAAYDAWVKAHPREARILELLGQGITHSTEGVEDPSSQAARREAQAECRLLGLRDELRVAVLNPLTIQFDREVGRQKLRSTFTRQELTLARSVHEGCRIRFARFTS